jgi:hypothetical protein
MPKATTSPTSHITIPSQLSSDNKVAMFTYRLIASCVTHERKSGYARGTASPAKSATYMFLAKVQ